MIKKIIIIKLKWHPIQGVLKSHAPSSRSTAAQTKTFRKLLRPDNSMHQAMELYCTDLLILKDISVIGFLMMMMVVVWWCESRGVDLGWDLVKLKGISWSTFHQWALVKRALFQHQGRNISKLSVDLQRPFYARPNCWSATQTLFFLSLWPISIALNNLHELLG